MDLAIIHTITLKKNAIMKKIILLASLLLAFAGFSFAQTTPAKTKSATAAKTTTTAKTSTTASTAKTTTAGPTKKDGTADMRYKANKDAAKAAPATTHVKKDGTPDKRYKENKAK